MKLASFTKDIMYHDERPTVQVMLNTDAGKEIRIAFRKGQIMKEHQTPFPIVVQVFEGAIDFGIRGEIQQLKKGDMIALEGGVPHDLNAQEDSLVRLSLSTSDSVKRVEKVVEE
ncbi:MAG TPA: cupin domain-containing protein [Flavobacteriaceae bacterium]|nr:cupin domain-containing protein [Flavobacteriaceae bacterium]